MVVAPVGVDGSVVIVSVELHPGEHDAGENAGVAPAGSPLAESVTGVVAPETRLSITFVAADVPA